MNERIKSLRDKAYRDPELQEQLQTSGHYFAFVEGFQTAHDILMEDAKILVDALEIYRGVHDKPSDMNPANRALREYYSKYGDKV